MLTSGTSKAISCEPGNTFFSTLRSDRSSSLGLPKKKQRFFFFKITDVSKFRRNINDLIPLITTVSQTQLDRDAIAKRPRKSDILHMGGLNIAFTHAGLLAVCISTTPIQALILTA